MLTKSPEDNNKKINKNNEQINYDQFLLNIYRRVIKDAEKELKDQNLNIEEPNNETTNYIVKRLTQQDVKFYLILKEIDEAINKDEITFDEAVCILFKLKPERIRQFIKSMYGSTYIPLKRINSIQRNKEIQELYDKKVSVKAIAKRFNMSSRRVYQIINKNKTNNN